MPRQLALSESVVNQSISGGAARERNTQILCNHVAVRDAGRDKSKARGNDRDVQPDVLRRCRGHLWSTVDSKGADP